MIVLNGAIFERSCEKTMMFISIFVNKIYLLEHAPKFYNCPRFCHLMLEKNGHGRKLNRRKSFHIDRNNLRYKPLWI